MNLQNAQCNKKDNWKFSLDLHSSLNSLSLSLSLSLSTRTDTSIQYNVLFYSSALQSNPELPSDCDIAWLRSCMSNGQSGREVCYLKQLTRRIIPIWNPSGCLKGVRLERWYADGQSLDGTWRNFEIFFFFFFKN